jgi:mRNA interferase RelE/StbE
MNFEIVYKNKCLKFFKKQDDSVAKRILDKINMLIDTPVPHNSKRVEGIDELIFRIRIGNCRVLYEVDYNEKIIGIIKIEKRSKVYD